MKIYTPDIYKISETVNEIQKKYMEDISEETLTMGIYGYLNETFSNSLQNTIIMASELGNEAFPIRAKFEKTILTNAVTYNISDINAVPSKMTVMIGFIERELEGQLREGKFTIDRECRFMIGEYEFHLDYDVIISQGELNDGTKIYSARYDIQRKNPISNVINPYLQTPIQLTVNGSKFIFITCDIRQVRYEKIYKKIITNNILENKTFDFEFEDQLAAFDILVKEKGNETYLTPIFEGMPSDSSEKYCFYNYLDNNTIRIKFDRDSYEPKLNCDIEIYLQTTDGASGIFNYKEDVIVGLKSDKINYNNLSALIRPITGSNSGVDRKSIEDLKEIIPKEILSRGNITNNKDLENFFNMIDVNNRLFFFRRRDNQFERLYYAYMIVKDNSDNIIPTNTINMKLCESDMVKSGNRYILRPGSTIEYRGNIGTVNKDLTYDEIIEKESKGFIYSSPFIMVINKYPLSVSYYLDVINRYYDFKYTYIDQNSDIQFISNYIKCEKNYLDMPNYKFTMNITQNMNINKNLVILDEFGNIIESRIRPVLVINDKSFKYYKIGEVKSFNLDSFSYDIEFNLETDNMIDDNNKIKITNIIPQGSVHPTSIYLSEKVSMSVHIYIDSNLSKIPLNESDNIVPGMDSYNLTNKYDTLEEVDLFYNYSHIINSKVKINKDDKSKAYNFDITGVPLVRYSYINDVERCNEFVDYIQFRKIYIDSALDTIENSFSVDLKFFNTYGPSKMFKIGHNKEILDKVNLTFNFKVKLLIGADKHATDYIIREIKSYVENINEISNIHMSNLITHLSNTFKSDIEFIEFLGINNYNSLYQYLEKSELELIEDVPEFLNINLTKDLKPDINILLV